MLNVAVLAVHQSAQASAGKTPAKGNAAAESAKGNFRQLLAPVLAVVKTTAKTSTQPMAGGSPANAGSAQASKGAIATLEAPLRSIAAVPKSGNADVKGARAGRTGAANKSAAREHTGRDGGEAAAPAATAAPALPVPADAVPREAAFATPASNQAADTLTLAVSGHPASQAPDAAEPTARPTIHAAISSKPAAQPAQKSRAGTPAQPPITGVQPDSGGIPKAGTSSHAAALARLPGKGSTVIAQLASALPGAGKAPSQVLHVSLNPATLGTVTVKIEQHQSGDARVTITASRPETLASLKNDSANLHQILTNAGLPEANRQIDFRAAPVAAAQAGAGLGSSGNSSMQNNSGGQPQHGIGFAALGSGGSGRSGNSAGHDPADSQGTGSASVATVSGQEMRAAPQRHPAAGSVDMTA